jgi:hypothetical protein
MSLPVSSSRSLVVFAFAVIVGAVAVACGGTGEDAEPAREEWVSETTTDGDVTTVRTISGSIWGGPAQLVEQLSIGVEAGEQPYMFGSIASVKATADRIYVLDRSVPALRVYDRQGQHLMDIGAEGDGPGEFRSPDGLVIAPDGRIFLNDTSQGRITVFSPEGELLDTWPLEMGGIRISGLGMVWANGKPYTAGLAGEMPDRMTMGQGGRMVRPPLGMVPRGPDGNDGDPIPQPQFDYEPPRFERVQRRREGGGMAVMVSMVEVPFVARQSWALSPSGAMVGGVGNDYSFDIHYPDGPVTRVAKDYEPVPIGAAEVDWHVEQVTAQMRENDPEWTWSGPEVPTVKPAYSNLVPDLSDRVWVERVGEGTENPECVRDPETMIWEPACWTDSRYYEVFDLEGRFLGAIETPENLRLSLNAHISGDEVFAAVEDELGVITVKRFQIVTPE